MHYYSVILIWLDTSFLSIAYCHFKYLFWMHNLWSILVKLTFESNDILRCICKFTLLSWRPIGWLLMNLDVYNWWFSRMKFAPIILVRSFWSWCLIVGSNFSVSMKNYPQSPDRVWHRLPPITPDSYFSPDTSSPITSDFHPTLRSPILSGNGTSAAYSSSSMNL